MYRERQGDCCVETTSVSQESLDVNKEVCDSMLKSAKLKIEQATSVLFLLETLFMQNNEAL